MAGLRGVISTGAPGEGMSIANISIHISTFPCKDDQKSKAGIQDNMLLFPSYNRVIQSQINSDIHTVLGLQTTKGRDILHVTVL